MEHGVLGMVTVGMVKTILYQSLILSLKYCEEMWKFKQTFLNCKQMIDVILDRFIMHAAVVGYFLSGCSGWPKAA